jgi:Saxitoxin biosynthesis operon protein SxtJ
MRWADLPLNPSARMLRQFAVLWILVFGGLALWHGVVRHDSTTGVVLAVVAATAGPVGLIAPTAIRPVFVAWMVLVFPIGWTVSRLMLLLLFAGIVTPVAVFFRLTGRDALGLKRRTQVSTYWTNKPAAPDVASYFRQS